MEADKEVSRWLWTLVWAIIMNQFCFPSDIAAISNVKEHYLITVEIYILFVFSTNAKFKESILNA